MLIPLTGSIRYLTFLQRISRDFDAMPRYISYIYGLNRVSYFRILGAARIGFSSSTNTRNCPSTANKVVALLLGLGIDRRDMSLKNNSETKSRVELTFIIDPTTRA